MTTTAMGREERDSSHCRVCANRVTPARLSNTYSVGPATHTQKFFFIYSPFFRHLYGNEILASSRRVAFFPPLRLISSFFSSLREERQQPRHSSDMLTCCVHSCCRLSSLPHCCCCCCCCLFSPLYSSLCPPLPESVVGSFLPCSQAPSSTL